jgi:hypothetical protein
MAIATELPFTGADASLEFERDFAIPTPHAACQRLAAGWLWLSVSALVGAGVFALLVVLARTPYVSSVFPTVDFFRSALVVHVDMSVLFWFFAFAGVLWSATSAPQRIRFGWAGLLLAAGGALVVVISPFVARGGPLMNNYVPVLQNPVFLTGLCLFGCGIGLAALRGLATVFSPAMGVDQIAPSLRFGLWTTAASTAMALIAVVWAFVTIPYFVHGLPYFEALFWGGGHVMQFAYTLMMLVGWLWLATECGAQVRLTQRITVAFFVLGVAPVFFTPTIYLTYGTTTYDNMEMFTRMMRVGGSLAALPIGLAVALAMWQRGYPEARAARPLFASLLCSLLLFGLGGGISLLIRDSNTIITAHYHATGGAVSVALMGMLYALLPKLGFCRPDWKLSCWQPYVYGSGQLLHIIGLLWSGGYGVQRKVAGADQALHGFAQIAGMGLMGIGGLVAVVGGLMFLWVAFGAMSTRTR